MLLSCVLCLLVNSAGAADRVIFLDDEPQVAVKRVQQATGRSRDELTATRLSELLLARPPVVVGAGSTEVCQGTPSAQSGIKAGLERADSAMAYFEWWYGDQDGDGYGDSEEAIYGCQGSGYVDNAGDCDDTDDSVSPDAEEVCDEVDNNCSGEVDVGASDMLTCHLDSDGDGYGRSHEGYQLVECTCPSGWVDNADDCDDEDADLTTDCR